MTLHRMESKNVKLRWSLLALLGVVFLIVAVTLLQPPAPPKPQPVVHMSNTGKVIFMVLPFALLVSLIVVMLRRAYKRGEIRRVRPGDDVKRIGHVMGRATDSVESTIHSRAACDAFFWLLSVMVLDNSACQFLDRQPPQLAWWPAVGMVVFGLAFALHRRRLT